MNKKLSLVLGSTALSVVLLVAVLVFVSFSNREVRIRNRVLAQQTSNEAVFDNTWKIIQQQAGVADEYRKAFGEIYPDLMAGRYGNTRGGALMSWIKEHNPQFDTQLYAKVASSIEVQRTIFTNEQRKLIDLHREHKTLLDTFPGSIILASRDPVEIVVVTSNKTKDAFTSKQENDLTVFGQR